MDTKIKALYNNYTSESVSPPPNLSLMVKYTGTKLVSFIYKHKF